MCQKFEKELEILSEKNYEQSRETCSYALKIIFDNFSK